MPFLKFSRDRRGYEHYYLVEAVSGRRGKTRQRVLYWFRTPPNVKVGREPFDDHVMRGLEAQYPGLRFDWDTLRNTPIPSVEPEYWRERRRADRAARRAQEEEEDGAEPAPSDRPTPLADQSTPAPPVADGPHVDDVVAAAIDGSGPEPSPVIAEPTGAVEPGTRNSAGLRRRRRRRGRGPVSGRIPAEGGPTEQTSSSSDDPKNVSPVATNDGREDM